MPDDTRNSLMTGIRIVFLDRATIAPQIRLRRPTFAHEFVEFQRTTEDEVVARLADADVAIVNKVPQPVGYFPHAWHLTVLKERIFSRWAPPSEFYVGGGDIAALVSFRIDRAGRISGVTVKESSGHARFDRSALAAIQGLAQVPALPEQYAEETLDVVIRFQNE